MQMMVWTENYKIGIPEIDVQHQYLFSVVNELHEEILRGRGHEYIENVLSKLIDYVEFHFSTEEKLMGEIVYPEMDEHCLQHLALKGRVLSFYEKFSEGSESLGEDMMLFLRDWLENHITVLDKKIGCYLNNS